MANEKISELDPVTSLEDTDLVPVVTDLDTTPKSKKITWTSLKSLLAALFQTLGNKVTSFQTTPDNTHYPSEKLVKDQLDLKIGGDTSYGGTVVTNLDTITKNGFYTCYGNATGVPNEDYSWFVLHQNSNVGTVSATQRAIAYLAGNPLIYERVKISSTWGAWYSPNSATVQQVCVDFATELAVADGVGYIIIPAECNGMNLISARADVITAGTTNASTFDIYNVTDSHSMLSSAISIASGATSGTGTVDTAHDDVATGDIIRIDCDTLSTTKPKGLIVSLSFRIP